MKKSKNMQSNCKDCKSVKDCKKNNVSNKSNNKINNIGFTNQDKSFELDENNEHSFELR